MAKEKFLIVAVGMGADMFGRFSETENCAAIDAGERSDDPYAWIEGSFEIVLVRHREATHLCSFTPSAWQVWLQNAFVGVPNEAWDENGDPDGLEWESGGQRGDYGTYRDEYDKRFICDTFTIDTMKDMNGLRASRSEAYHNAIWEHAEEIARDLIANGAGYEAPILDVYTFRQWQKEQRDRIRAASLRESRLFALA